MTDCCVVGILFSNCLRHVSSGLKAVTPAAGLFVLPTCIVSILLFLYVMGNK